MNFSAPMSGHVLSVRTLKGSGQDGRSSAVRKRTNRTQPDKPDAVAKQRRNGVEAKSRSRPTLSGRGIA